MTLSLWQRLDQTGRHLAPGLVTVVLVLASSIPLYLPNYERVVPILALMAVYFWAIHRPDLIRPSAAFMIGLLQDLLSGGTLGLNALLLVLVHWVVVTQRGFFLANSFLMLWWGFALTAFGAGVLLWLAGSMLFLHFLPVDAFLFQALLTICLFPPFAWLFIRVHRTFLVMP